MSLFCLAASETKRLKEIPPGIKEGLIEGTVF
jgi:hypothetical protein